MKKLFKTVNNGKYPNQATGRSAGYDLHAISWEEVGDVLIYDTGVRLNELPDGYHIKLYPRYTIFETDLRLANGVTVIDADYQDTIKVVFDFRKDKSFGDLKKYVAGDIVARLVVEPHYTEQAEDEPQIKRDLSNVGKGKKRVYKKRSKGGK